MSGCGRDPSLATLFAEIEQIGAGVGVFFNFVGIAYVVNGKNRVHVDLKYLLLNVQIWLAVCDLIASFFLIPDFLLPLPVFYPLGMFSMLGIPTTIQLLISVTAFGVAGSAILHLFFIRHQSVLPADHPRRFSGKIKALIVVFFYLLFGTYGVPLFFSIPWDQAKAKDVESTVRTLFAAACIPDEFWEDRAIVFNRTNFTFLLVYTLGYLIAWSLIAFCSILESFYIVNAEMVYSTTTRGLIRNSFKSIIAQLVSSFLFLIIPILMFIGAHFFFIIPQKWGYIFVFFFSMHAAFGKITIVFFSSHFRSFLRSRLSATALYLLRPPKRRRNDMQQKR